MARIPMTEVNPVTQLDLRFLSATNVLAQHPSAGVAEVGATAARYLRMGTLSPSDVHTAPLEGDRLRSLVAITAITHNLVGAYGMTNESLKRTVPFAYHGLVIGSFVSTAVEFGEGRQGRALDAIDIIDGDQRERFAQLAQSERRLDRLGTALSDIGGALTRPDGSAQDHIDIYHGSILEISAKYGATPDAGPGRQQELGEARDSLAEALTPIALDAVTGLGAHEADVLVHNVMRHNPTQAVLNTYFGQPQA
ncbi:MAG TPA: hypothetical protein VLF71_02225 [Candidatus Saccharimonadales bacterium]|nr:hypothetical protein [Candidatus Saccharimonadales bacterium]